jgi:hypothetical protein
MTLRDAMDIALKRIDIQAVISASLSTDLVADAASAMPNFQILKYLLFRQEVKH